MRLNEIAGYKLMHYQRAATDYVKSRKYSCLALDMGLGKSIISSWAAKELEAKKIIIICPATIQLQWSELIKKFNPDFTVEIGTNQPVSVRHYHKWVLILSYQRASSEKMLRDLKSIECDFMIIDEFHLIKNPRANRTKKLLGKGSYLINAKKICLMSGTPILNRPSEAYMFLKTFAPALLGPYLPWPIYVRTFCGYKGTGASRTDELQQILSRFILRRTKEEVLKELPPIVESVVHLNGIDDPLHEYLPTRRRIVSIGKIPQIIDFVEDKLNTVEKVVLVCYHRETIETIQLHFKDKCVALAGGLNNKERQERLHEFQTNPRINLLIGQLSVIGFGTDGLQHNCNNIIFGEIDWTPGSLDQAKDRLRRIGQKATVMVNYLLAAGTVEDSIDLKLEWKRKIINQLIKPSELLNDWNVEDIEL